VQYLRGAPALRNGECVLADVPGPRSSQGADPSPNRQAYCLLKWEAAALHPANQDMFEPPDYRHFDDAD
jgi:hypothetical protein